MIALLGATALGLSGSHCLPAMFCPSKSGAVVAQLPGHTATGQLADRIGVSCRC